MISFKLDRCNLEDSAVNRAARTPRRAKRGGEIGMNVATRDRDLTIDDVNEHAASSDLQGIENEKVAPCSSLALAQRRPSWLSMIERLIARPTPIPVALVV